MKKNILPTILLISSLAASTLSAAQVFETAHPYANNENKSGTFSIPNASCMKVTLNGKLENNYDFITVNGTKYTGTLNKSFEVKSSSLKYNFTTDGSVVKNGVTLSAEPCLKDTVSVASISNSVKLQGGYEKHHIALSQATTKDTEFDYIIGGITAQREGDEPDFKVIPTFSNKKIHMNKDNSKIIVPAGISKFTILIKTNRSWSKELDMYTYIIAVGKIYAIGEIKTYDE